MPGRVGPLVRTTTTYSCEGCLHESHEKYTCQSDRGFDHYCNEPTMQAKREAADEKDNRTYMGESTSTPDWCPFREGA